MAISEPMTTAANDQVSRAEVLGGDDSRRDQPTESAATPSAERHTPLGDEDARRAQLLSEEAARRAELLGDQEAQECVLEGLAEAVNHRRWFAGLANPYLGDHPIEVGSGFGDYAEEWLPRVERFTCTEAEPDRLTGLKERFGENPKVDVRHMLLPCDESGDHSSLVTYNVLEHIEEDVEALRSMSRLVRPGAPIVVVVPAFPFAMSHIDIATGHVRRYTKKSMRKAMEDAGLIPEHIQYVNALGLIGYYSATSIFKLTPKKGNMVLWYDRWVAPVTKFMEKFVRPPFGQSVLAIARTPVK